MPFPAVYQYGSPLYFLFWGKGGIGGIVVKYKGGGRRESMGIGIIVCGLNGVGKSTLGKALAEKLNFYFIDNEDLYFPKTDSKYMYAIPRTREKTKPIEENINFIIKQINFTMIQ